MVSRYLEPDGARKGGTKHVLVKWGDCVVIGCDHYSGRNLESVEPRRGVEASELATGFGDLGQVMAKRRVQVSVDAVGHFSGNVSSRRDECHGLLRCPSDRTDRTEGYPSGGIVAEVGGGRAQDDALDDFRPVPGHQKGYGSTHGVPEHHCRSGSQVLQQVCSVISAGTQGEWLV